MERKFTDDEIMEMLENCSDRSGIGIARAIIDLINRKNAEIERLTINMYAARLGMIAEHERLQTARAEAIKEFAERVKRYIDVGHLRSPTEKCFSELQIAGIVDRIAKKMTEATYEIRKDMADL